VISASDVPGSIAWDYDRSELVADAIVHVIGVALGLAGAVVITIVAVNSEQGSLTLPLAIYTVGLLAMLGLSAAYNVWPVSRAKWILRRLDHSAIYLMIAGTYTPFIAQIESVPLAISLMTGVWLTALVGIAIKIVWPGRFDRLAVVLYLLLGWCGVLAYQPISAALTSVSLALLVGGGVVYSTGVIFHAWRNLRFQNAIWHGFVLVAAACHYFAVIHCLNGA